MDEEREKLVATNLEEGLPVKKIAKSQFLRMLLILISISSISIFLLFVYFSGNNDQSISKNDPFNSTLPQEVVKNATVVATKPLASQSDINQITAEGLDETEYEWVYSAEYPDGSYISEQGFDIVIKHVEHDNVFKLTSTSLFVDVAAIKISRDLKFVLVSTDYEGGWRHSSFANYWIFDIQNKKAQRLSTSKSNKTIDGQLGSGKVAWSTWSPTGHNVAWARDNDLYVTIDGKKEIKITNDGSANIINGISDWVYEEEVLAEKRATWFSPNSKHLAFIKFNDTLVKEYHLNYYAKYSKTSYPKEIDVKYPKPGTPNPVAHLYVSTLDLVNQNCSSVYVELNAYSDEDRVFTQVNWLDNERFLVRIMNRVQDSLTLYLVSLQNDTWHPEIIRQETTSDGAWWETRQPLRVIENSDSYVELKDDESGYSHIAYYQSISSKTPTKYLTKGQWDVDRILGISNGIIYYSSTKDDSTQRHIYSVDFEGKNTKMTPHPETTIRSIVSNLDYPQGTKLETGYFTAKFSPKCEYYSLAYHGPDIPWERIYSTKSNFTSLVTSYNYYRPTWSKFSLPLTKYFRIPNEEGNWMNARMVVPPNFDSSGAKKYPILMEIYGGPGSQRVVQKYHVGFNTKIANYGIIHLVVDGRGTGFRGRAYRSIVSKNLGKYETIDIITAAKWMSSQPYVDSKHISIWGWSYGGYLTLKVLEANSGIINYGIAVAPVTDWRFYDTMYTERYMKTPQMNPIGYHDSGVVKMEGFKNAKLLLMHGTADDNVHFQNSANFVWDLTGAGIYNFSSQFYTDSDHSMGANGAYNMVYKKLETFLCTEFAMKCS